MYPQNNLGAGAQWAFATTIVLVILALTLGVLISNSDWFQPQIAQAKAEGMNKNNDVEYQKSLVDLEKYRNDARVAMARSQRALENQKITERQTAEFRQNLYATLNSGLQALLIAASFVVAAWGLTACLKSYQLALKRTNTSQAVSRPVRRAPSAAAQQARQREISQRQARLAQGTSSHIEYLYTRPFWPGDGD